MIKSELGYRQHLIDIMGGRWLVAINRENNLNPGIPDLSFLMVAPGHEMGWLELKFSQMPRRKTGTLDLQVEPSQHQWMLRYAHRVPTFFLIGVSDQSFLINGTHHQQLASKVSLDDLNRLAIMKATEDDLVIRLATTLSELTKRNRNGC